MSDKGKITKHHSIALADQVLAELRKIWPKTWEGWLRCWSNGREQGYHLQVTTWDDVKGERAEAGCVFSEARSSDGVLVVIGPRDEFAPFGGLQPSDKLWDAGEEHRRYFHDTSNIQQTWSKELRGRKQKLAAKWIVKRFRKLRAESRMEWRDKKRNVVKVKAS